MVVKEFEFRSEGGEEMKSNKLEVLLQFDDFAPKQGASHFQVLSPGLYQLPLTSLTDFYRARSLFN